MSLAPASWVALVMLLWMAGCGAALAAPDSGTPDAQPSIAFYYGSAPPVHELAQFDRVVVDASGVDASGLSALRRDGARVYAYLSLGENDRNTQDAPDLPKSAVLGDNKAWHSQVVDLASPAWRHYILDQRVPKLWKDGYRGLFPDTLDSYELFAKTPAERARQENALASLIQAIHAKFLGIHLLLNRGFPVLPQVHQDVDGVVTESLFKQWDQAKQRYTDVDASGRKWLLGTLRKVQQDYHLPVTVIDYLPPDQRQAAREDAKRIEALGFTPWVTNATLDEVGVGSIDVRPRRVLMLYVLEKPNDPTDDIAAQQINALAAVPLEYLGYVPVYHEIHIPLPEGVLRGRYAGIVTWFNHPVPHPRAYQRWLSKQMKDGVPVAILGNFGTALSGALLQKMSLRPVSDLGETGLQVVKRDDMMGFEGKRAVVPPGGGAGYWPDAADVQTHLVVRDAKGRSMATVLTGPWGGIALNPWITESAPITATESFFGQQQRWLLDPFRFFRTALHLQPMPVVDPTTENGNRIATAHIDGDGFNNRANMPGTPFSAQVIRDRVLKRFGFPTTVSVITSDFDPHGRFPKEVPQLIQLARSIFALPSVEIASHTYSHPFDWLQVYPGMPAGQDQHNLPIPGYRFSFRKEIDGSVDYINKHLAPPGKKVKVLLWSGDALPPLRAMALVHQLGIQQMNGGNTQIDKRYPSLTNVSPMTRPVGPYEQIYAPDMNDEIFTNGYHGPYWGFEHAIQKVYEYVLSRPILPMFTSTYCRIVDNFRTVGVARRSGGQWLISGATEDRTLRLPQGQWPDLKASPQVVGVRSLPQGRYVSLSGAPRVELVLSPSRPSVPYLESANGRVAAWQRTVDGFSLRLQATMPLKAELANVGPGCTVTAPGASQRRLPGGRVRLGFGGQASGSIRVACR